jgi:RNA polymerase sigma-70 factor (ECF subfamily)
VAAIGGGRESPHTEAFRAHERRLWSLLYRLTGSAADADDLLQDTFVRAIEHPPANPDAPLFPWLVRVAVNLGRDALRRRRQRPYVGPWLPAPVESVDDAGISAEGRYGLVESASLAFLAALEALTPQQRAVLLLRDVLDYSVRETADALGLSEANVKTTHHRSRRAMAAYDARRLPITAHLQEMTRTALARFLGHLAVGDAHGLEQLLAEDVRGLTDGAGEFVAALRPIIGPSKLTRFVLGVVPRGTSSYSVDSLMLNGLPALLVKFHTPIERRASRFVVTVDVDAAGRIRELRVVMAARKLTHVSFDRDR